MLACSKLCNLCGNGELLSLRLWTSLRPENRSFKHLVTATIPTIPAKKGLNKNSSPAFRSKRLFTTNKQLLAPKDDYYRRLDVSPNATADEIKSAFYRHSKQYHPDVSQSKEASEVFLQIRDAYDVLGNALKRKEYDKSLGIGEGDQVVEDMFPPGWRDRQQKKREKKKADDEMGFSSDDIKTAKKRYMEAADEYKAYKAHRSPRPEGVDPKNHEAKQMWLDFTTWANGHYGRNLTFYRVMFVCLVGCFWREYRYYLPFYDARKRDEFDRLKGPEHSEWIWSDFARRWKWRQNLDRLPEMLEEERKSEKEQMFEQYSRGNCED